MTKPLSERLAEAFDKSSYLESGAWVSDNIDEILAALRAHEAEGEPDEVCSGHSDQWRQGRRHGVKFCVSWLRDRAFQMFDPKARAILYSASFNLGIAAKQRRASSGGEWRDYPLPAAPEKPA